MPPKAQAQVKQAQQQESSAPLDEREQMAYNDERRRAREFAHRGGADRPDTPAGFGGLPAERHHHRESHSGRGRLDTIRSDHSYHQSPSSRRAHPQHASTSRGYASTPGASSSAHTPSSARYPQSSRSAQHTTRFHSSARLSAREVGTPKQARQAALRERQQEEERDRRERERAKRERARKAALRAASEADGLAAEDLARRNAAREALFGEAASSLGILEGGLFGDAAWAADQTRRGVEGWASQPRSPSRSRSPGRYNPGPFHSPENYTSAGYYNRPGRCVTSTPLPSSSAGVPAISP